MSTLDGIPVGTLRSNLAEMHIEGTDWCKMMGKHQWRTDRDGSVYCRDCFTTLDEANKAYYEQIKKGGINQGGINSQTAEGRALGQEGV